MLRILKEHEIVVSFNTGGHRITEERARFFVEHGIDSITVSIDGATAETYNRIRLGADFDRVVRSLEHLDELKRVDPERKGKPYLIVGFVLMSVNVHELPAMVDLCRRIGAAKLHVEPLLRMRNPIYEETVYSRYCLSRVPSGRVVAAFEETTRRARERGVIIAGPYVDEEGRLRPERVEIYDSSGPGGAP
jgi:MoaA/NifB/PqqE/SkfB family radical SAM enzyme